MFPEDFIYETKVLWFDLLLLKMWGGLTVIKMPERSPWWSRTQPLFCSCFCCLLWRVKLAKTSFDWCLNALMKFQQKTASDRCQWMCDAFIDAMLSFSTVLWLAGSSAKAAYRFYIESLPLISYQVNGNWQCSNCCEIHWRNMGTT